MTVCVAVDWAVEAAVRVTVKAVVTVAGAVKVTPVVVEFESVPQLEPVQPVRLQVTPAFRGPPVTVAVKLAELPGSMVSLAGPVMVITDGALVFPPQPVSAEIPSANRRVAERARALPMTRRGQEGCLPGSVYKRASTDGNAVSIRYAGFPALPESLSGKCCSQASLGLV